MNADQERTRLSGQRSGASDALPLGARLGALATLILAVAASSAVGAEPARTGKVKVYKPLPAKAMTAEKPPADKPAPELKAAGASKAKPAPKMKAKPAPKKAEPKKAEPKKAALKEKKAPPKKAAPAKGDKTKVPAPPKPGPDKPEAPDDGPSYQISRFELSYGQEHPDHPSLEPMLQMPIVLGKTDEGYVAPRESVVTETITLGQFGNGRPATFFASAIRRINEQLVAAFNRRGLVGIFVAPHKDDIDVKTGKDLRKGDTTLELVIWSAEVSRVRTLAAGQRVPEDERINHPAHSRILDHSPLESGDLLNKRKLDRYTYWLNRHPGRRADAAVTSGTKPGDVAVDYLISENKPWLVYAQSSNTGTQSTDQWRHRFGFIHNQLTGNDDIFSIDYTAPCFDEPAAQSATASYEAPFFNLDRLRWRVYGSWARYRAEIDTFASAFGDNWNGWEWRLGGEMAWNFFQDKELFLDLVGGAYWWKLHVEHMETLSEGDAALFIPYVGARVERLTDVANTVGSVMLEFNCQSIGGSDYEDLARLGRSPVDADWVLWKWDFLQSFYLEPLLNPEGWRDVSTPESSTLAHEVAFMFRGQWAMSGYRMIPQAQRVVGGFFSVRGYRESSVAGDTALIGTAEYRLHVPRLLEIQDDPTKTPLPLVGTPFRWTPQTVFGRPDWDLIFRAFFDVGRTMQTDRMLALNEENHTLMSTGIGFELQFTKHFNVRLDWGFPLRDLETSTVRIKSCEDHRLHFVATVLY